MAFTIKYRSFQPAAARSVDPSVPTFYDMVEQISGPYDLVSQEVEDGFIVVHAHGPNGAPACTFGPYNTAETPEPPASAPRPTLWVMNDNGATVAKYDL